ncbi:hypothetical protein K458DRAFT_464497 [Lentithecium fluviatile CBS 122367]|uniref:Uncharacterized protein n=1 Tax=Lentithecium fluviatile CBS 122367 TaxID=1168545 RepID=A0A6G1II17_9PLEO|nr:hypothetical protein K458DRAFT_464497 [Lentithecium fluviatile CBS 122367]
MKAIYSKVATVASWIGSDDNGEMGSAVTAMKSICKVAVSSPNWLEDLGWMRECPSLLEVDQDFSSIPNQTWRSLERFFSSPYWGCVWVLQEMALARSLWVVVGQHVLDYEDIKWTMQLIRHINSNSGPKEDCGKSTSEVYSEVVSRWIMATGDLFFLGWAVAAQFPDRETPTLPSWIPEWHEISRDKSWQPFPVSAFHSNDGLDVLCPSQVQVLDASRLRVHACIIDTISAIQPIRGPDSANLIRLYRDFMKKRKEVESLTGLPYLQVILRTVLADTFPQHQGSIVDLHPVRLQGLLLTTIYILQGLASSAPVLETLRSTIEELGIATEEHVASFLRVLFPGMAISQSWNSEKQVDLCVLHYGHYLNPQLSRCFKEQYLFHTSTGYIGSCRGGIRAGDMIGVLQGCPTPVLLRQEGTQYANLGTCFVLGLMEGEAALQVEQGSLEIHQVDLI